MTALENVLVGMHSRLKGGILGSIIGTPRVRREERQARERALELLDYCGLGGHHDDFARNLSYGDQRRLEVARALATRAEAAAPRRADGRHEPAGDARLRVVRPQGP